MIEVFPSRQEGPADVKSHLQHQRVREKQSGPDSESELLWHAQESKRGRRSVVFYVTTRFDSRYPGNASACLP